MKAPVSAQEMKEIEKTAASRGISYLTMMENAGIAAAEEIIKEYKPEGKIVIIAVGKGNNGGDGYVVARLLQAAGAMVMIIMAEGLPVTDSAKINFDRCLQCGIEVVQYEPQTSDPFFQGADFIVDAVYGAGFHGSFREPAASAIRAINASDAKKIALDLPSGLNADTGECAPDAVQADTTVTFARLKKGQTTAEGLQLCGKLVLKDIGLE
ncbi:NAD(P)H-hydrate epimerase [Ructibacterium gallinarum]|uniref:NAD(P)H-hydrate epimerase n=1 Tax=Ructibacterium gallinarum TaxID=2779355 RepID=A0A9D5M1I5_9FIRM|nr:NAD(P)H-hydrate epimerase [Ructibacterium gallinarum]MBE5039698.1 NAD(P)H-hydrate epimerase [Ructibacterium gallinarum]